MIRRAAVLVVVVALAAGALRAWSRATVGSLPTIVARSGTFVDYLQLRGEIRPVRSLVLAAPSSGGGDMQIVQLAPNGATVAAGDLIVQFDSTVQQRALEQRESELRQAESELERTGAEGRRRLQAAETERAQAVSAAARARLDVHGSDLIARVDASKRELELANAELQVKALEQKLEGERQAVAAERALAGQKRDKARQDVEETRRIIASLAVRAPSAGVISLLPNFRAGGPMSGSPPEFRRGDRAWMGAAIAELPDLSAVQMTCRLDEADRARVQRGAPVLVRVDALPDRELTATLAEIALVARPDFSSWPPVRNFDALVAIEAVDPRLRSGMSASARIELDRLSDVVVVPSGAVFQVDGAAVVYVIDGAGPVRRTVSVARRGRDQIAIGSGLADGERVALRDPAAGDPP